MRLLRQVLKTELGKKAWQKDRNALLHVCLGCTSARDAKLNVIKTIADGTYNGWTKA